MRKTTNQHTLTAICIGAANLDICSAFDQPSIDAISNIASISQTVGGAALNTARMLASNNIATTFIGLVGEDEGADVIDGALAQARVKTATIKQSGASTGRYISLLEPDGSLKIACNDMKIHEKFTLELLRQQISLEKHSDIGAVFCDANIPTHIIHQAFELMPRSLKCATTVSPSKANRLNDSLEYMDVLFTNVAEAHALLGLSSSAGTRDLAKLLAASPVKSGAISDGSNPVYFWQDREIGSLPVPDTNGIIDVIGAGDALAAGTIAELLNGKSLAEALICGIKTAQKVLRVKGAYSPDSPNSPPKL